MLSNLSSLLNNILLSKKYVIIFWVLNVIFFLLAVTLIGISHYTVDSWWYYALSNVSTPNNFYYLDGNYNIKFPFGFPLIIKLINALFNLGPYAALLINAIVWGFTIIVIRKICLIHRLDTLTFSVLCLGLLSYTGYWSELICGRSIPLAILFFISAYYFFCKSFFVSCGFLLGLSTLIRFDFVSYCLIFWLGQVLLSRPSLKISVNILTGIILGMLPWIFYSLNHYGLFWASNNSWVALSAIQTDSAQYPAKAIISLLDDPKMYLFKILHTLPKFCKSFISSINSFYIAALALTIFFIGKPAIKELNRGNVAVILVLCLLSTAPYITTGFMDSRYFSLIFLIISFSILASIKISATPFFWGINISTSYMLILVIEILTLSSNYLHEFLKKEEQTQILRNDSEIIEKLYSCHKKHPELTFIFDRGHVRLSSKYRALKRARVTNLPSNYQKMTPSLKRQFFEGHKPFKIIADERFIKGCN
jgi:hypothetical protein